MYIKIHNFTIKDDILTLLCGEMTVFVPMGYINCLCINRIIFILLINALYLQMFV